MGKVKKQKGFQRIDDNRKDRPLAVTRFTDVASKRALADNLGQALAPSQPDPPTVTPRWSGLRRRPTAS